MALVLRFVLPATTLLPFLLTSKMLTAALYLAAYCTLGSLLVERSVPLRGVRRLATAKELAQPYRCSIRGEPGFLWFRTRHQHHGNKRCSCGLLLGRLQLDRYLLYMLRSVLLTCFQVLARRECNKEFKSKQRIKGYAHYPRCVPMVPLRKS